MVTHDALLNSREQMATERGHLLAARLGGRPLRSNDLRRTTTTMPQFGRCKILRGAGAQTPTARLVRQGSGRRPAPAAYSIARGDTVDVASGVSAPTIGRRVCETVRRHGPPRRSVRLAASAARAVSALLQEKREHRLVADMPPVVASTSAITSGLTAARRLRGARGCERAPRRAPPRTGSA